MRERAEGDDGTCYSYSEDTGFAVNMATYPLTPPNTHTRKTQSVDN